MDSLIFTAGLRNSRINDGFNVLEAFQKTRMYAFNYLPNDS